MIQRSTTKVFAWALVLIPLAIVVVWHWKNLKWPNDDAADYMRTSVSIYNEFKTGSIFSGLKAVLNDRGWRPIAFPVLAVPFLTVSGGNVLFAQAGVLCFLLGIWTLYIYLLARRFLDVVSASVLTLFVASSVLFLNPFLTFFAEAAWLPAMIAFAYHLEKSEHFKVPSHSLLAGLALGCAMTMRPAESFLITFVPLFFLAVSRGNGALVRRNVLGALGVAGTSGGLLVISAFSSSITRGFLIFLAFFMAGLISLAIFRKSKVPGLVLFAGGLSFVSLMWWAGFMPALYSWAHETTFGPMAKITDVKIRDGSWLEACSTLLHSTITPPFLLSIVLGLIAFGISKWRRDSKTDLITMFAISIGGIVPMLGMYLASGTSDPRRLLVPLAFCLITALTLAFQKGLFRSVNICLVAVLAALQLTGSIPAWETIRPPNREPDFNMATLNEILKRVTPGSNVAVYTQALHFYPARIWEPATLSLASKILGDPVSFIYFWDDADYDRVLKRYTDSNVHYLVLDGFRAPKGTASHQPTMQFSSILLDYLDRGISSPPGLKQLDKWFAGDRPQYLFQILAENKRDR